MNQCNILKLLKSNVIDDKPSTIIDLSEENTLEKSYIINQNKNGKSHLDFKIYK